MRLLQTDTLAKLAALSSLAFACLASGTLTQASGFPAHPISVVVPFSAGGPTDSVGRALAEAMRRALGESVIVENKAGAGGTIGTSYVARAKPDGYTTLLMHVGFTTAPSLYQNPGYQVDGFAPIGMVVDVPMTLIAHADFPANNVQELISYLRLNQDKVTMANAGIGSASHLCGIMLNQALGTQLLSVPYKGTGPAMHDLLGKRVDLMCDQTTNTMPHIRSGTVKAFAVTSAERIATLPGLPTLQEAGLADFEISIWHGLWAPKNTPPETLSVLNTALHQAVSDPDFEQRMSLSGTRTLPHQTSPPALQQKVEQQVLQWAKLFKAADIQAQNK